MSIATEIQRLETARNTLRAKAVNLKIGTSTDKIDALATAYDGIANNGAVSANVKEGETYTIPKGYHNGSGTVSGIAGGGNYTLQSKQITPTKSQQNINPDSGYYGLSDVTVAAIPEAYHNVTSVTASAADVLANKVIVDAGGGVVAGTMPNNGSVTKTLDTNAVSYTVPKGYHSGAGTIKIVTEAKTVTPTKSNQTITPTSGKVLSSVSVNAIPAKYVDTAAATAVAGEILGGKTAYAGGKLVEGTMANNGSTSGTIDGLSSTSFAIPAGYTTGGTVTLTGDVESALAAI